MYLREAPTATLADILDSVETGHPARTTTISSDEVVLDFTEESVIRLGNIEVPATKEGKQAFADRFGVPSAFLFRQDEEFQQIILRGLLDRFHDATTFAFTDEGVIEARDPRTETIPVSRLVGKVTKVMGEKSLVRDFWADAQDFRLDVIVPDGHEAVYGDRKVGDFSQAGLRIMQDRKHNLAPSVQPYQYRLACTNGMTTRHDGLKIDARGSTVEQVLAEFEAIADLAFRQAQDDMETFYALRSQKVDNPERMLIRLASDAGLPQRTVARLAESVPLFEQETEDGVLSMFDLVNVITNQANDPSVKRAGTRLALEAAGGSVVSEHSERCHACQSRLVH